MISGRPRTIHLTKGSEGRYEEGRAGGTITPGMLIALNSSGVYVAHPTSTGKAIPQFAIEDVFQGKTIDDNYSSGDLVRNVITSVGDHVLGILAAGQNVAVGALLASNGAGSLIASTTNPVAIAVEARDASVSGVTLTARRVRVRIVD